jgi:hypothetical protein
LPLHSSYLPLGVPNGLVNHHAQGRLLPHQLGISFFSGAITTVSSRHRVDDFTFGGFCDRYYADFFNSGDKWISASSRRWCCFYYAYFCCGS